MGIRTTDAQAVDPRPSQPPQRRKRRQAVIDPEGRAFKIDGRVRCLIVQRRGDFPVMQRQRGLDQRRHPRRRVQMADIGLDRADAGRISEAGRCTAS